MDEGQPIRANLQCLAPSGATTQRAKGAASRMGVMRRLMMLPVRRRGRGMIFALGTHINQADYQVAIVGSADLNMEFSFSNKKKITN